MESPSYLKFDEEKLVYDMVARAKQDRFKLEEKGIKSPDISKMERVRVDFQTLYFKK
jgi:hypothetical protein